MTCPNNRAEVCSQLLIVGNANSHLQSELHLKIYVHKSTVLGPTISCKVWKKFDTQQQIKVYKKIAQYGREKVTRHLSLLKLKYSTSKGKEGKVLGSISPLKYVVWCALS
jgi:hypothetical protein